MIINSHVHFNTNKDFFFYNDYNIKRLISEMNENNVDIALPCLNPKIGEMRCVNDCSWNCNNCGNIVNNNLQYCSNQCVYRNRHRGVVTSKKGKYVLKCKTCGENIIKSDIDPLRKYNIELIRQTQKYNNRLKPLLYLSLCEATLQSEIEYFESNFKGMFYGFKFHPWTDQVSIKNFRIKTQLPILIHTGLREFEKVEDAIIFAEKHPKNMIVLAHAAQLKKNVLSEIQESDNIFMDCCPSSFLFKNREICFENYQAIQSAEDIYYTALSIVSSDKILFGTDSPWGSTENELNVIRNLNISNSDKENILFRTAERVYL